MTLILLILSLFSLTIQIITHGKLVKFFHVDMTPGYALMVFVPQIAVLILLVCSL